MQKRYLLLILLIVLLTGGGCATFYQKTMAVQKDIAGGNFESALKSLERDKKWPQNNHRVLYFMNKGVVHFMLGEHEASNAWFDRADLYIEDYRKNIGFEALALVSNPMVRPYRPEDFEAIMVHYYKALNFIALGNFEGALIECRRINLLLLAFNENYKEQIHTGRFCPQPNGSGLPGGGRLQQCLHCLPQCAGDLRKRLPILVWPAGTPAIETGFALHCPHDRLS